MRSSEVAERVRAAQRSQKQVVVQLKQKAEQRKLNANFCNVTELGLIIRSPDTSAIFPLDLIETIDVAP